MHKALETLELLRYILEYPEKRDQARWGLTCRATSMWLLAMKLAWREMVDMEPLLRLFGEDLLIATKDGLISLFEDLPFMF